MSDEFLSEEQALRQKIEKRIKARDEARVSIFVHILVFLFINTWLFGFDTWVRELLSGSFSIPHLITAVWGFGLLMNIIDYSSNHGYGYDRRQRRIDKEYERLMRLRNPKRKNDDLFMEASNTLTDDQEIYLNEDGEITFAKKS